MSETRTTKGAHLLGACRVTVFLYAPIPRVMNILVPGKTRVLGNMC